MVPSQNSNEAGLEPPSPFGPALKADFPFAPSYTNLNHGSFGAVPNSIRAKLQDYQALATSRPDPFLRYEYTELTNAARAAAAAVTNSPLESVVFVANATEGVNTIFRNLHWGQTAGQQDVIIYFNTIYEACRRTIQFITDYHADKVSAREITLTYPLEDAVVVELFRDTVAQIRAEGKNPRVAIFDVVSSMPGVCFPWKDMVRACREFGVLSLVDGAQGIGMVELDLAAVDPDFFTSNCHKWLFVPMGCAVLHVPPRNQHLLPTTLATTARYLPQSSSPPAENFALRFEFVGTKDYAPWYCVPDAVAYRRDVLGGEAAIIAYLQRLNKDGSKLVAEALRTDVLDNKAGTLTDCAMANVALPIWVGEKGPRANEDDAVVAPADRTLLLDWISKTLYKDYNTFVPPYIMNGRVWVRLSAQVYLDIKDYEFAAETLQHLCKRVAEKEYFNTA
ncbi:putative aminotransferase [Escovopsis weberi]|uniref:Putative aminotransferase n=1 Tax=Escovopsis weberi TaxID=150374 RepID=A0A0M8N9L3_ESCWE|nr:putative aminotransferase [Escovopsis weberi]